MHIHHRHLIRMGRQARIHHHPSIDQNFRCLLDGFLLIRKKKTWSNFLVKLVLSLRSRSKKGLRLSTTNLKKTSKTQSPNSTANLSWVKLSLLSEPMAVKIQEWSVLEGHAIVVVNQVILPVIVACLQTTVVVAVAILADTVVAVAVDILAAMVVAAVMIVDTLEVAHVDTVVVDMNVLLDILHTLPLLHNKVPVVLQLVTFALLLLNKPQPTLRLHKLMTTAVALTKPSFESKKKEYCMIFFLSFSLFLFTEFLFFSLSTHQENKQNSFSFSEKQSERCQSINQVRLVRSSSKKKNGNQRYLNP
mmetsp:Transcript_13526/g.20396  ORF Transcript_13526/g.20396 Transcript_13526/m.20396 type:complete len:305 (+) Transcript_13526:255-1169(+)